METNEPEKAGMKAALKVSPEHRARRVRLRAVINRMGEVKGEVKSFKDEIAALRESLKKTAKESPDHGKLRSRLRQILDMPKTLHAEGKALREEKRQLKEVLRPTDPPES